MYLKVRTDDLPSLSLSAINWAVARILEINVDIMTPERQHPLAELKRDGFTDEQIEVIQGQSTYLIGDRNTRPFRIDYVNDWQQGGEIADKYIHGMEDTTMRGSNGNFRYKAWINLKKGGRIAGYGSSYQMACAMCFIRSMVGDEMEIPMELIENNSKKAKISP